VSNASENFADFGLPVLLEQQGEAVLFESAEFGSATVTAIPGPIVAPQETGSTGRTKLAYSREVLLRVSEVGDSFAGAKITISGQVWRVSDILSLDGVMARVKVERVADQSVVRPMR